MNKKINNPDGIPKGGETKPTITQSDLVKLLESKEVQTLPNVIICRRYSSDRQNDMGALQNELPEILENITYLNNPGEVVKNLKSDTRNIVFVGQYFDYTMTGLEVAKAVKQKGLDTEIILLTSIDISNYYLSDCDHYFKTSKSFNVPDGAKMIVQHLKSSIKNSKQEKIPEKNSEKNSEEVLLNEKLELLHLCLLPSKIPTELPQILSAYSESFTTFKQSIQGCVDCLDDQYIKALSTFRDILFGQ